MIKAVSKYIFHFLVIILIQVIVLNGVSLFRIVHPYLYLVFLILLPVNFSRGWTLIVAFFTGFLIDVFSFTYGIHTIASVFVGYLRPYMLRLFINEDINQVIYEPHINTIGARNFVVFVTMITLIHHTVMLFTESFTFHYFFFTIYKILVNTIFTVLLVLLYELIAFYKRD